jgi:DNA-binding transcriptional MerR regulator
VQNRQQMIKLGCANLASKHAGAKATLRAHVRGVIAPTARSRYLFGMRIGEIAKQAGLNIQSVRFYERKGLLPMPPRYPSGYRSYDERHLETIRFIKRGQGLGFSLHEIRHLLELHQSLATSPLVVSRKKSSRESERLVLLARERLATIEQKIKILEAMQKQLSGFLREYRSARKLVCPAAKK